MLKNKLVLDVVYRDGAGDEVASFSGSVEELNKCHKIIGEVIARHDSQSSSEDDMEECPGCGSKAPAEKLLKEGCSICGWASPRLKKRR